MTRRLVEENVNISLQRMRVEKLDLMQFHWWEYRDKNYLDALQCLSELQSSRELNTVSLRKYKNMVDAWGGWSLFQSLLSTLKNIANKHIVSISNVAARYILEQPTVAGVIVGAKLGVSEHLIDNAKVFNLKLDTEALK